MELLDVKNYEELLKYFEDVKQERNQYLNIVSNINKEMWDFLSREYSELKQYQNLREKCDKVDKYITSIMGKSYDTGRDIYLKESEKISKNNSEYSTYIQNLWEQSDLDFIELSNYLEYLEFKFNEVNSIVSSTFFYHGKYQRNINGERENEDWIAFLINVLNEKYPDRKYELKIFPAVSVEEKEGSKTFNPILCDFVTIVAKDFDIEKYYENSKPHYSDKWLGKNVEDLNYIIYAMVPRCLSLSHIPIDLFDFNRQKSCFIQKYGMTNEFVNEINNRLFEEWKCRIGTQKLAKRTELEKKLEQYK